jgi:DNA polymerase IIIc chi subunit
LGEKFVLLLAEEDEEENEIDRTLWRWKREAFSAGECVASAERHLLNSLSLLCSFFFV